MSTEFSQIYTCKRVARHAEHQGVVVPPRRGIAGEKKRSPRPGNLGKQSWYL